MTKDEFYNLWPMNEDFCPKEQHLVVKLRDIGFSWDQINSVFTIMTKGSYSDEWNIANSDSRKLEAISGLYRTLDRYEERLAKMRRGDFKDRVEIGLSINEEIDSILGCIDITNREIKKLEEA